MPAWVDNIRGGDWRWRQSTKHDRGSPRSLKEAQALGIFPKEDVALSAQATPEAGGRVREELFLTEGTTVYVVRTMSVPHGAEGKVANKSPVCRQPGKVFVVIEERSPTARKVAVKKSNMLTEVPAFYTCFPEGATFPNPSRRLIQSVLDAICPDGYEHCSMAIERCYGLAMGRERH